MVCGSQSIRSGSTDKFVCLNFNFLYHRITWKASQVFSAFQESKGALSNWIDEQAGREQAIERVPGMVKTFLEDFRNMEPRVQKAHLQTILKAAYVSRVKFDLEFRV